MATAIGTDTVTAIARRHIMPSIVDAIYGSNVLFYRMVKGNKKMIQGGTHIEQPVNYKKSGLGGAYSGYEQLSTAASDDHSWPHSGQTGAGLNVAKHAGQVETEIDAAQELYKLTRSLLALQFQSMESHKRSKHLDRLESILRQYAFRNEQEALEFAKSSLTNEPDSDGEASDGTIMIA